MSLERYTIREGDTLRQIARRLLGNADQWWVLAELNQLTPPFLDTTGGTYPAGSRVLGVGDALLLPASLADPAVQRATLAVEVDPYDVLLGCDLALSAQGDLQANAGTGDWRTVSGVENLKQTLLHRLMTRKGELVYHPEYGSNLDLYLGQPLDLSTVSLIRLEAMQTLLSDPRIRALINVTVEAQADHVVIDATCQVIGADDIVPLNLVLPRAA